MALMTESARKPYMEGSELLHMMVRSVNNGHMSNSKMAYVSNGKDTSSSILRWGRWMWLAVSALLTNLIPLFHLDTNRTTLGMDFKISTNSPERNIHRIALKSVIWDQGKSNERSGLGTLNRCSRCSC